MLLALARLVQQQLVELDVEHRLDLGQQQLQQQQPHQEDRQEAIHGWEVLQVLFGKLREDKMEEELPTELADPDQLHPHPNGLVEGHWESKCRERPLQDHATQQAAHLVVLSAASLHTARLVVDALVVVDKGACFCQATHQVDTPHHASFLWMVLSILRVVRSHRNHLKDHASLKAVHGSLWHHCLHLICGFCVVCCGCGWHRFSSCARARGLPPRADSDGGRRRRPRAV